MYLRYVYGQHPCSYQELHKLRVSGIGDKPCLDDAGGPTSLFSILYSNLWSCRLSCKSPWIGANQLPKDFGYPEHEERDILYTSYLRSEALHLRVQ